MGKLGSFMSKKSTTTSPPRKGESVGTLFVSAMTGPAGLSQRRTFELGWTDVAPFQFYSQGVLELLAFATVLVSTSWDRV